MTPAQEKRCREAIEFLRTFKPREAGGVLLMDFWGSHPATDHKPAECGTTACAAGWLAVRRIAGLRPRWNQVGREHGLMPAYRNAEGYGALEKVFGLSLPALHTVFSGRNNDTTLRTVATRFQRELDKALKAPTP